MNVNYKKTRILTYFTFLTLFFTSFCVNSAKFLDADLQLDKNDLEWSKVNKLPADYLLKSFVDTEKAKLANNYQRIIELIHKKQYKKANRELDSHIEAAPMEPIYLNLRAVLNVRNKEFILAEKNYNKVLELDSKNIQALLGLSATSLEAKNYALAKQYVDKVLKYSPAQASAYIMLSKIAFDQYGLDAAEKQLLNAAVRLKGNVKEELIILQLLVAEYSNRNQLKKVFPLVKDLFVRNEANLHVSSFYASVLLMNQDQAAAEKILRQIIKQYPKDTKHKVMLAKLLSRQKGKDDEVLSLLDQAIISSNNAISTLVLKAAYLIKMGEFQKAYDVADTIESINPKLSVAKILKGDVHLNEGEYAQSFQFYKQAYSLDPSSKVRESMVKLLVLQDKLQDAIDLLENDLLIKADISAQFRLANLYQKIKNYKQALKYYLMVANKDKDNALVLNNLAWVYSLLGDYSKAEEVAEKAHKLMPKSAIIADTYGYILLGNGKKQESLTLLQQAVESMPGLDEIQLHLAESYLANDNKHQAVKILEQLVDKNSKEKEKAIKIMERLK